MSVSRWITGLLSVAAFLALTLSIPAGAVGTESPRPWNAPCPESDRFGVAMVGWELDAYDVGQLNAGWYHNFGLLPTPTRPAGMQFVQTIRLSDDGPFPDRACSDCPTWQSLGALVAANPGSLWAVGNEQDRQDYVTATRYAQLYHEFYYFLKTQDPSCQVAIGGVVQTTPIRLQYLDMILDAYQNQYGRAMPVDVWNIHNYVLREGVTGWGCGIPPGTNPALARDYGLQDHDNIDWWTEQVIMMREWMRDRGYRDRPLIISEFGILMPDIYGYDYPRVREFMLETFDWLMTATDPDTGYPADGNRLVQSWAWYSLNDAHFEGFDSWNHVFDPDTRVITPLGLDFAAYTAPLGTPAVDLQPVGLRHSPPEPEGGSFVTVTMTARVYNGGGSPASNVVVQFQRDSAPAGTSVIPSLGPGDAGSASGVWPNLNWGQSYQASVTVDPGGLVPECDEANNTLSTSFVVTDLRFYLPVVRRSW